MSFTSIDESIKYLIPPHGVTVTFHVPSKCRNNCSFCVVNSNYYSDCSNFNKERLLMIADSFDVADVDAFVISGGEPLDDIKFMMNLARQLKSLDTVKPVYVNTQFPINALMDFNDATRETYGQNLQCNVDGISISRHAASQADERFAIEGVPDYFIKQYAEKIPIRINCVLNDHSDIASIVNRWKDSNVTVSFRRDYMSLIPSSLHEPSMNRFYEAGFTGAIHIDGCNICDTKRLIYKESTNATFYIHSGLYSTCLRHTFDGVDYYELHDVVVLPDGRVFDDWNIKMAHEIKI